jgi:hypothetical protein
MRIQQSVDKWIVLAVMLITGILDLAFSTLPGAGVFDWIVVPLLGALIAVTVYVVWCALWRFVLRLVGAERHARTFANGLAVLGFAFAVFGPVLFPGRVLRETVDIPAKKTIHWPWSGGSLSMPSNNRWIGP